MLALDGAVPASIATPREPLTRLPDPAKSDPTAFWRNQRFRVAGWGQADTQGNMPRYRQVADAGGGEFPCATAFGFAQNMICPRRKDGSSVLPGDSGGPLYWRDDASGKEYVVGALQGVEGSNRAGRWTVTFGGHLRTGAGVYASTPLGITLGEWIDQGIAQRIPAQLIGQRQVSQPTWTASETVPLFEWWSSARGDNFLTSDPRWSARSDQLVWGDDVVLSGADSQQGYDLSRIAGRAFDPKAPKPEGTVPLFSWWSSTRKDNFATTDPRWGVPVDDIQWNGESVANGPDQSGYTLYRLEGYIFDPKKTRPPGTVPLWSWWSPEREDNFATSKRDWGMHPEQVRWQGEHLANGRSRQSGVEYSLYRLEGYLPTMDCSNALF